LIDLIDRIVYIEVLQKITIWEVCMMRRIMLFVCLGIVLSDFAEAQRMNLLSGGKVIASGYEGMPVYIFEGDYDDTTFTTKNGELQDLAYVGVLRNRQMTIESALFWGGPVREDGGWFDSSATPVEFQYLETPDGDWQTAAVIESYPTLDGVDSAAATPLHMNQTFEITFDQPISAVGFRVAGKGASGNNPDQSYVSISELQAFGTLGDPVDTYESTQLDGAYPIATNFTHPMQNGAPLGDEMWDGHVSTYIRAQELVDLFEFDVFFGFYSASPLTLNSISFIHGVLIDEGGWFTTEGAKPRVEIKRTLTGDWEVAGTLESYPDVTFETTPDTFPEGFETEPHTFTFSEPSTVYGVRFIGEAVLILADPPYVQVAEIQIDGEGSAAYSGPLGNGLNTDGEPFQMEDGVIHLPAERARSINDAYQIYGHGEAEDGYVVRFNFGTSFNEFSGQILEWDVEIPEENLYYAFAQYHTINTWGDSLFIDFDDPIENAPDTLNPTNDIRWVPLTPAPNSPFILKREWISTDLSGQDNPEFWELDAGTHTLRIGLREPVITLDYIVITADSAKDFAAYEAPTDSPVTAITDFQLY
jgi:hypothetical protein